MKRDAPCMDCDERRVGCHAECERYKVWRKQLDEQNRLARLSKQATKYPVIIWPDEGKE